MATLLEQFQQQEEAAKAANLARYSEAMQIYDEIISRYRPGGEFGKAALGQLEKRKVRDVGKETQQLISSGLYGTTTMAATGRRWEEAVGGPERLKLEDIQMQRLSQAQIGKAGFMERREDIGPDYGMVAGLYQQAGAGGYGVPKTVTRTTGEKGPSPWEPGFMGGGWTLGDGGTSAAQPGARPAPTPGGLQPTAEMFRKTAAPAEPTAAPTIPEYLRMPGGDTAAYNAWAAEMRRRYPNKPVMPQSRWQRLVKPKMGATYGQFAGGTYGQTS